MILCALTALKGTAITITEDLTPATAARYPRMREMPSLPGDIIW